MEEEEEADPGLKSGALVDECWISDLGFGIRGSGLGQGVGIRVRVQELGPRVSDPWAWDAFAFC